MTLLPIVALLAAAVIIGLIMAPRALKGERNRPLLIAAHILLGAAALEPLAIAMHATGRIDAAGSLGTATFLLIGLALASGVIRALLVRQSPALRTPLLALHGSIAAAALVSAIMLAAKLG